MKTLVLFCAALGDKLFHAEAGHDVWGELNLQSAASPFPALTCPVQASFRTAAPVKVHGMGASGYFDRPLRKAFFWEQSSGLYDGERFWSDFRRKGGYTGQICLQQCPGPESDLYLSPGPVHKHHGGMIQSFYSKPDEMYSQICTSIGKKFNLMDYWGPFPSIHGTEWIAAATCDVMKFLTREHREDCLLLSYLPHMDYALQKYGPGTKQTSSAFAAFECEVAKVVRDARQNGFRVLILGDYEIGAVSLAVYPNQALLQAGWLTDRRAGGMSYLNLHSSRAFALADHQVCHIYCFDPSILDDVQRTVSALPGVARVMRRDETPELNHPRCGELILEAEEDAWFSYRWWDDERLAPDFATHVDIHNKPGFDPLELFWTVWPPMGTAQDSSLLKGSHGRSCRVAVASDFKLGQNADSIIDIAAFLRDSLV